MTPEDLNTITTEWKRFGTELNLSDAQKEQLREMAKAREFFGQRAATA